jgi:hypothetical protein
MYSNSYSFYNNVCMTNEKNNLNIFGALVLGIGILLVTGWTKIDTLLDANLLISFVVFSLLSYISIRAYKDYKYLAIIMFGSIFLLSPEVFAANKGELFPITYITFMVYFSILFGKSLYRKWKSSL